MIMLMQKPLKTEGEREQQKKPFKTEGEREQPRLAVLKGMQGL